ncbi:MAG: hypothetical protein LBK99_14385 [Opitutaceae bacterium]|nr:hypothetical protein [Opitutaceae bacterium]
MRIRHTAFTPPGDPAGTGVRPPLHTIWQALVTNEGRNRLITADLLDCVRAGRSPLVLADRTACLDLLERSLVSFAPEVACYRLDGRMGAKARRGVLEAITRHYEAEESFVLFATASLAGEGLDIPRLDTLFLAMPLSFRGRLVQYAGRLHRDHEVKAGVLIHDYLDAGHPLTEAMFRRRVSAYAKMGYEIEDDADPPSQADALPLTEMKSALLHVHATKSEEVDREQPLGLHSLSGTSKP